MSKEGKGSAKSIAEMVDKYARVTLSLLLYHHTITRMVERYYYLHYV